MISTNNKKRKSSFNRFVGWLETGFFCIPFVYSTRTNMSRLMQQVRDEVFHKKVESVSKACRKHVANPHELVENLAANVVENQVCSQVCSWLE